MIDFERDIYDRVARAILDKYPECYVTSGYTPSVPSFPAASVEETTNTVLESALDSSGDEVAASVTYTVNAYAAGDGDLKSQARGIISAADDAMRSLNMTRVSMLPIDNAPDPSVYRLVARYVGVVGADGTTYRR